MENRRGYFSQSLRGQKDLWEANSVSEVKSNRDGSRDLYYFCLVPVCMLSAVFILYQLVFFTDCGCTGSGRKHANTV